MFQEFGIYFNLFLVCSNDYIIPQRVSSLQSQICRSFCSFDLNCKFLTDMFKTLCSLPTATVSDSSPNPCNYGNALDLLINC